MDEVHRLATPQPNNIGDELDLHEREVAVRSINLSVNASCIDKEHLILAFSRGLALVEKPKGARQRNRVEEVRSN